MLTPSEIDLLQQDLKATIERNEETAAIELERKAFRRRQQAVAAVAAQFLPKGNGQPTRDSINESTAADVAWHEAQANVARILDEIRTGKR